MVADSKDRKKTKKVKIVKKKEKKSKKRIYQIVVNNRLINKKKLEDGVKKEGIWIINKKKDLNQLYFSKKVVSKILLSIK